MYCCIFAQRTTNKIDYAVVKEFIYVQDEELSYRQKCIFCLSALCLEFIHIPSSTYLLKEFTETTL